MKISPVSTAKDFHSFFTISKEVYQDNPFYRATEADLVRKLVKGPTVFHAHASVKPYLITKSGKPVGRFALIHDRKLPDYVQIAFFEALPGLPDLAEQILSEARLAEPQCLKFVIGLSGHLNYSAGMLLNHFDEAPVFGLPYTPAYYPDYFSQFELQTMVSYRFPCRPFYEFMQDTDKAPDLGGITVRTLNKRRFKEDIGIYTALNNACFAQHPFWADRTVEEDLELFNPFRPLLREEYFLFAEYQGKPIGFLLWYPDFNELVKGQGQLNPLHIIKHRLRDPITTFRLTQIAVLPEHRISKATLALILHMIPPIKKAGYQFGEGGFIFEDNSPCLNMSARFLQRGTGDILEPYRRYGMFEGEL